MFRVIVLFIAVWVVVFQNTSSVYADCPDWVDCCTKPDMKYVGHFSAPTCYKFLVGCYPWKCSGQDYSHDLQCEWDRKCREKFPRECGEHGCAACFPTFDIDKGDCSCGWAPCPQ